MNLEELKELLELIAAQDITEFELEEQGVKLKIKKGPAAAPAPTNHDGPVVAPPAALPEGAASAPAPSPEAVAEPTDVSFVLSPMVGTFYRAPEPGAPPFVEVGDRVKPGQVLCIIEAMKLMNEIESEYAGEIVEIFPENGTPVQYGDRLFAIRVSGG